MGKNNQSGEYDGLFARLSLYLENMDDAPKKSSKVEAIIDIVSYLRENERASRVELQDSIYPQYETEWRNKRAMWEDLHRYFDDVPGIDPSGFWLEFPGDDAFQAEVEGDEYDYGEAAMNELRAYLSSSPSPPSTEHDIEAMIEVVTELRRQQIENTSGSAFSAVSSEHAEQWLSKSDMIECLIRYFPNVPAVTRTERGGWKYVGDNNVRKHIEEMEEKDVKKR